MSIVTKKQENLVWYACYGSNIMYERFLCYIQGGTFYANNKPHDGCPDKAPPHSSKPIIIPYEMYFGNKSKWWNNSGVAFLDTSRKGITLGRMYLITEEQYKNIWKDEGKSDNWYNKEISLGEFEGCPIKTFTNSERRDENILNRLYDTFDGDYISKNDDGSYDLSVTIPEEEWVYGYILSFGSNAEVLEPEHIREIIKTRAKEILEKY